MLITTDSAIKVANLGITAVNDDSRRAKKYLSHTATVEDPELRYTLESAVLNDQIDRQWRKDGRQILSIDPELAEVLGRAEGNIVTEALLALPYRSPYISFPAPTQVGEDRRKGTTGHLIGAYVCGRSGADTIVSTHEPGTRNLLLLLIVEVRDAATQETTDFDLLRITIPITREPTTLDDVISAALSRGRYTAFDGSRAQGINTYIESMLGHCLSAMFYLCSTTFDAETIPARQTRKRWASGNTKPPVFTKVGWRVGPAISKARREATESSGSPTGATRAPHAVRAHFRTVWTGKGRTVPKIAFIAPYMTGTGELDVPTVHSVK